MIKLICDKTQSLRQFTDDNCAQASFFFSRLLKEKEIKVNGKKVGENVTLSVGDEVCYFLTKKQEERLGFEIVYEDENVLIVDKESGVNSEAVFSALSRKYAGRCAFIHRLDRNTCGILAFAKTEKAAFVLLDAFKTRKVEKTYHALCFGRFPKKQDVLSAYLKKDETRALVTVFDAPTQGSAQIVTEYKILAETEGCTKVEIRLHTGKTHQIRAHLAHIGCPVVGDMKYGDETKNKAKNVARQCLVAKRLVFALLGEFSYLNEKEFVSKFDV